MGRQKQSVILKALYWARDLFSRDLFDALGAYGKGRVLDVGGSDFYLTAQKRKVNFDIWVTLEKSKEFAPLVQGDKVRYVCGEGCGIPFKDGSVDTVLNFQVLEHVFEPFRMVREMTRVLKPGGFGIFLIPQTGALHCAPDHFYNFTRFWIEKTMKESGLDIVQLKPLGGLWSSTASRFFYFFLQSARVRGFSTKEIRRNLLFFILFPFMALYALVNIPICLFLSLGDLHEEPNNHLVVVRKR